MKLLKLILIALTVGLMSFVSADPVETINQNDEVVTIASANMNVFVEVENPYFMCTYISKDLVVQNLYVPRQHNFIPELNGIEIKTPCFYSGKYNNNKNIQKNIWLEINDIITDKSLAYNNGKSCGGLSVPCQIEVYI